MSPLFREEVLQARGSQLLGTIRIAHNPRFTLVAAVALLLGAALVAYAVLGEITRKARLPGILAHAEGTLNLAATQAGTLREILVAEGDTVRAGQLLVRVGVDRVTGSGDTAVLVAQSLEQRRGGLRTERTLAEQQHRQRQQASTDRIRSMEAEMHRVDSELAAIRGRLALARRSVERFAELGRSGYVADIQVQQRQEELLDLAAREAGAERAMLALSRDAQSLRAEMAAAENALKTTLAQLDRTLATLEQERTENDARRELLVRAPQHGVVGAITLKPGQPVQAGQTVAALVPVRADGTPSPLEAQLYAPSRTVGFVQPGQPVWLRYGAFAYQKFGMARGVVQSVSATPIAAQDLPNGQAQALQSAAGSQEPMYRITVALERQTFTAYGRQQPLRAGMTLDADVLQERRRIWEWMLEPVLAASGLSRAWAGAER